MTHTASLKIVYKIRRVNGMKHEAPPFKKDKGREIGI